MRRPFIDADGRLLPCIPSSGLTAAMGIEYGNVFHDSLQELYTESPLTKQLSVTCGQIKKSSQRCSQCPHLSYCSAGCRVEAMVQGNGLNGIDERVCSFFADGCYDRLKAIADRWGLHAGR